MDSPAPMNRRTALKRAGALAVALGALEAVGPFSFAPMRVGAFIIPSDIQFAVSAFLAVPPQNYGTGVQFQLPPVRTVSHAKVRVVQEPAEVAARATCTDCSRRPRRLALTAGFA